MFFLITQFNLSSVRIFLDLQDFAPEIQWPMESFSFFSRLNHINIYNDITVKPCYFMEGSLFALCFCKAKHFPWQDCSSPYKKFIPFKKLFITLVNLNWSCQISSKHPEESVSCVTKCINSGISFHSRSKSRWMNDLKLLYVCCCLKELSCLV